MYMSNMSVCVCVCVCLCVSERDPLKEYVVANTVLYESAVNGRDAPKWTFWAENQLFCLTNLYII